MWRVVRSLLPTRGFPDGVSALDVERSVVAPLDGAGDSVHARRRPAGKQTRRRIRKSNVGARHARALKGHIRACRRFFPCEFNDDAIRMRLFGDLPVKPLLNGIGRLAYVTPYGGWHRRAKMPSPHACHRMAGPMTNACRSLDRRAAWERPLRAGNEIICYSHWGV